jgi:hypothetical protein
MVKSSPNRTSVFFLGQKRTSCPCSSPTVFVRRALSRKVAKPARFRYTFRMDTINLSPGTSHQAGLGANRIRRTAKLSDRRSPITAL